MTTTRLRWFEYIKNGIESKAKKVAKFGMVSQAVQRTA